MPKKQKMWIIKYALSTGIEVLECEVEGTRARHVSRHRQQGFTVNVEAFEFEADARVAAKAKAERAIKALERKRAKLEKLVEKFGGAG